MSFIKDTFFGGAEKKAAAAQTKAFEQAQVFTRQGVEQARQDLFKLFPAARQNIQQGFQGALDVFGQALPAQTQAFQQGNVAAQQAILAGLPQQQQAILGGQVDFSQLQPFQQQLQQGQQGAGSLFGGQPSPAPAPLGGVTPIDLSFFQQQLPQLVDPLTAVPQVVDTNIPVSPRLFNRLAGSRNQFRRR